MMTDNNRSNLSAKDEALLILEYLENEQMSKTFLHFLDENKHLTQLCSRLHFNYLNPDQFKYEIDSEVLDFQSFFNLSKENEHINDQTFLSSQQIHSITSHTHDFFFDDDFLNVGLNDLLSQTPPMDHQHDLPDTPLPSVPPIHEDFNTTLEQLFAMSQEPLVTSISPPPATVQMIPDSTPKPSFTKCIVVTQDFLQSMYTQQQQQPTMTNNSTNPISRPKRRRRRFKVGKENHSQQRKIMPRT